MRISRTLALGASLLVLLGACTTGGGSSPTASSGGSAAPSTAASGAAASIGQASSSDPTIKVGSDGFYEAKLMAEIYAQALEVHGYKIDRTGIGIGARAVSAP